MIEYTLYRTDGSEIDTFEIACSEDASDNVKAGIAAIKAFDAGVDLSEADLSKADFATASLIENADVEVSSILESIRWANILGDNCIKENTTGAAPIGFEDDNMAEDW